MARSSRESQSWRRAAVPGVHRAPLSQPAEERPLALPSDLAIVQCVFTAEGDPGDLVAFEAGGGGSVASETDDALTLSLPTGTWNIAWERNGRTTMLGEVELAGGTVYRCRVGEDWQVHGTVRNLQGKPLAGARVEGCNAVAETDAQGRYSLATRRAGCELMALVTDGLLSRPSAPVTFSALDTDRAYDFAVDDGPVAGMGIQVMPADEGIRVMTVFGGTPADEAGLLEGDLILKVDGHDTEGMSPTDFVAVGLGTEGSMVNLLVSNDSGTRRVQFRRERIEDVEATERRTEGLAIPEEELRERLEREINEGRK